MGADPKSLADQRQVERQVVAVPLRLLLGEQELSGTTRDASAGGVMFTTDAPLEVEIELEEDGRLVRRKGRLSRVQRLNADEVAFAVEFDRE